MIVVSHGSSCSAQERAKHGGAAELVADRGHDTERQGRRERERTIKMRCGRTLGAVALLCLPAASGSNNLGRTTGDPLTAAAATADTVDVQLWRGLDDDGRTPSFPELLLPELREKRNSGVAFSGGGLRAYTATLGYLRGLLDLELLQQTRYITGVSGGAWASAVFSYYRPEAGPHVAQNDSMLLGAHVAPGDLNAAALGNLPRHSARHCATSGLGTNLEGVAATDWVKQIEQVFMEPMGVPTGPGASFSWDVRTADNIALRNREFISLEQLAVAHQRPWGAPPYMVLGLTLLAPLDVTPLDLTNRSYTVLDATPLYVGQARTVPVTFSPRSKLFPPQPLPVTLKVSGLIQPFAAGGAAPDVALGPGQDTAMVQVPAPARPFSLGQAVAASSFFPADILADFSRELSRSLGFLYQFWPPSPGSATPPSNRRGAHR